MLLIVTKEPGLHGLSGGNIDDARKRAAELTTPAADIILAAGSLALGPLLQATRYSHRQIGR
jgi:hypothetical protein